jgi:hypothetical protein
MVCLRRGVVFAETCLQTLRRDGAAWCGALPYLRGIKSDLRNTSGRIEPECFCTFQSTRVNRHSMVLVTTPP